MPSPPGPSGNPPHQSVTIRGASLPSKLKSSKRYSRKSRRSGRR